MEDQIIQLLTDTQATDESTRRHAEDRLQQLYGDKRFPRHLISIASKTHSPVNVRQSALICLKNYVLSTWSPNFDEFKGDVLLGPSDKEEIRQAVLEIAIGDNIERKVTSSASFIVSKIATVDYPEEWSELLPILLHVIPTGSEDQVRGALKVLAELVDDCLNEHQFFVVARDLVKLLFDVAADEKRSSVIRALALSAFRPCFDTLEAIMEKHKNEVRQFAEEILHTWISLLVQILRLRSSAQGLEGGDNSKVQLPHDFAGIVALKLQAVKVE